MEATKNPEVFPEDMHSVDNIEFLAASRAAIGQCAIDPDLAIALDHALISITAELRHLRNHTCNCVNMPVEKYPGESKLRLTRA